MENLELLKKLFDQFHEAIYIVDNNRKIVYFNPQAEAITGFSRIEMENSFCYDNKLNHITEDGVNICIEGCPLMQSIKEDVIKEHYVYLHHKQGHRIKVHVRTIPVHNKQGKIHGAIEVFSDLTEKNLFFEEVKIKESLSYIDALTDTFNRHYLNIEVPKLLESDLSKYIGIGFIDIDEFKKINDEYGHHIGDIVLSEISKTVSKNLTGKDSLIRYGGDEFIILMFADTKEEITRLVDKLKMLMKATIIRYNGLEINVDVSLGLSIIESDEDIKEAIDKADQAMYAVKKQKQQSRV